MRRIFRESRRLKSLEDYTVCVKCQISRDSQLLNSVAHYTGTLFSANGLLPDSLTRLFYSSSIS